MARFSGRYYHGDPLPDEIEERCLESLLTLRGEHDKETKLNALGRILGYFDEYLDTEPQRAARTVFYYISTELLRGERYLIDAMFSWMHKTARLENRHGRDAFAIHLHRAGAH